MFGWTLVMVQRIIQTNIVGKTLCTDDLVTMLIKMDSKNKE